MPFERMPITTPQGKRLFSWFIAATPKAPVIIILHGWAASAEMMLPLAVPFYKQGFNILLLDARNHGRSDADGHSSLPRFADDLHSAISELQAHPSRHNGKFILVGHSVGAGAALYEASRRQDICAVISVSSFAHPAWLMRRRLQRHPIPAVLISGILHYIEWVIGVRFEIIAPMNTVCKINCPVLLIHGAADKTVPISDAFAIRENCAKTDLELLIIQGAGHNAVHQIEQQAPKVLAFLHRTGCYPSAE